MYRLNKAHSILFVVLLLVLALGQTASAQDCPDDMITPQWVLDRQQYETTFVYEPMRKTESCIPQWVLDRQQYETTFVYPIEAAASAQIVQDVPQWVLDRQQYETTFVYEPTTKHDIQPVEIVLDDSGS